MENHSIIQQKERHLPKKRRKSGQKQIKLPLLSPQPVIHSDVIPLEDDYILLQVSGQSSGFKLSVENGAKVNPEVLMSLYNDDQLVQKATLQHRVDWQLDNLGPGSYRVKFNEKTGLQFQIE